MRSPLMIIALFAFALTAQPARAADVVTWRPIVPEDLAQKTSTVEKDADAEAIFWDVRIDDRPGYGVNKTFMQSYIRIKVFSARGVEARSRIDLPFYNDTEITE